MTNSNTPAKTPERSQNKDSDDLNKKKQPVDVATLEKSRATSEIDKESSDPIAVGEASG